MKCRDIGEAHCVAVNMSLFLTKNGGSLEGFTNDGIRDALKVQGMLIGSYQNHFLRPGWFPESKEEYLCPVKIKRHGDLKNAKSLNCIYIKRVFFSTDELPVLDSGN